MGKLLKALKSKKGFSLAYAMVVCLFLALVTGGVTTIALLQHNETGADLNTRQAYISAKSGLDSLKNHMKNGTVTLDTSSLTSVGASRFFVMYTDESGMVNIIYRETEEDIKAFLKSDQLANATIIGGNGTYYQVTLKEDGIFGVTSKNETGKYNDNVTLNKGDLTFDAVTYTKYIVSEKEVETTPVGPPPTFPVINVPTDPPSDDSLGGPLELVTKKETSTYRHQTTGKFLMIGQQYAFNDAEIVKGSAEGSQAGLLKTEGKESTVTWDKNPFFYHVNIETTDDYASYVSYFPIVYDRMAKVTSTSDRCSIEAFNQGIYFCGDFEAYRQGNEYANSYSHEQYQWLENKGSINNLGNISYTTENPEWQFKMGCNFLCIENNFIHRMRNGSVKHVTVYYSGTDDNKKIYVQIPKGMWVYNCWESKDNNAPYQSYFYIPAGYYSFTNQFSLTDIYTWYNAGDIITGKGGAPTNILDRVPKTMVTKAAELEVAKSYSLYDDIVYYEQNGTVHSGGQELNKGDHNVSIIDSDQGKYNDDVGGPYYSTNAGNANYQYSSAFDDANIFFAPRFSMGNNNPKNVSASAQEGTYHWYCGKSFNFQWFRKFSFQVPTNYNIEISAPNIVLTIGPTVTVYNGSKNSTTTSQSSDLIESTGTNNSFILCGNKGKGGTILRVMCDFRVKYSGGTYTIKKGTYELDKPINLFTDAAKNAFGGNTASSASCIVAPGLSKQTFTLSSVFANMFRGTIIANDMYIVDRISTGSSTLAEVKYDDLSNASGRVPGIGIPSNLTDVQYGEITEFNGGEVFELPIRDGFKIQKQVGNGAYVDYIIFEGLDENANFDCYIPTGGEDYLYLEDCHGHLQEHQLEESSNYTVSVEGPFTEIIGDYY